MIPILLAQESHPLGASAPQPPAAAAPAASAVVAWMFALQWILVLSLIAAAGLGVLLWSRYSARIEAGAAAGSSRRSATMLAGAGSALFALVLLGNMEKAPRAVWVATVSLLVAWFVLGFTADALRTGRRLRGCGGTRTLLAGWLVRASALAVPLAWPVVAVYLLVSALGNPLVALFGAGNDTTTPSDGSSSDL